MAWKQWQKEPDRQCRHKGILRRFRAVKRISITYSEYVFVALGIQHAMLMHHMVICGYPAVQYFSTLSHNQHDFIN